MRAAVVLLLVLAGCATAPAEDKEVAQLRARCAAEGGCAVFSRQSLESLVRGAYDAGKNTCRREQAL